MNRIKTLIARTSVTLLPFIPAVALAQFGEVNTFVGKITTFINNTLVPLIFGLALLVFIFGMFRFFIWNGHTDDGKKQGKDLMIYAVVAFVLMVSIWGIVNLIAGGLGFTGQTVNNIPTVPTR